MDGNLAYDYIPEEPWEELIDGKVVAMSPSPAVNHNYTAENILSIFRTHLRGKQCRPFGDRYDLHLSDAEQYIPDFMIVCDRSKIKPTGIYGAPDLVCEVLSPSTEKYDRGHKKDIYEKFGVKEYWLVDTVRRSIEQYLLVNGKYVLNEIYRSCTDWMLEEMNEADRKSIVKEFKCSLYDDFSIKLDEVFEGLI